MPMVFSSTLILPNFAFFHFTFSQAYVLVLVKVRISVLKGNL